MTASARLVNSLVSRNLRSANCLNVIKSSLGRETRAICSPRTRRGAWQRRRCPGSTPGGRWVSTLCGSCSPRRSTASSWPSPRDSSGWAPGTGPWSTSHTSGGSPSGTSSSGTCSRNTRSRRKGSLNVTFVTSLLHLNAHWSLIRNRYISVFSTRMIIILIETRKQDMIYFSNFILIEIDVTFMYFILYEAQGTLLHSLH